MKSSSLPEGVAATLRQVARPGARLLVGLSGGVDSVTLLSILAELRPALGIGLAALHVNHGISPNAESWERFCEDLCRGLDVPCRVERVQIGPYREHGLEGAARRARYDAYARANTDFIVLAHHRDDQVETLLLQLFRGAGARGLAAMPMTRPLPGSQAILLRPLLGYPRAQIEAIARDRCLDWIEDESNDDTTRQRNFLRHRVLPLVEEQFPAVRRAVARAAYHLAEAGDLQNEIGRADVQALTHESGLSVEGLRELGPVRARNALRTLIRSCGESAPGRARTEEMLRQLLQAGSDRMVRFRFADWELRRYRGQVVMARQRPAVSSKEIDVWRGEACLPLLALGGVLRFKAEEGRGLSARMLQSAPVTIRLRAGGEQIRPGVDRPNRTLKKLMQELAVPPWRRALWPLVYCGEEFVCAPGIAENGEWRAVAGESGWIITWEPLD